MKSKAKLSLRRQFLAFDDELARRGVPPCTEWWRDGIGRWLDAYERDHVLELWGCVGRGAAKSTALYKLALFFTLAGDFRIPPGERHLAVILSRLKEEAAKGLDIISAWLTLLGIGHHVAGDVIELETMPRGIRVVAASVAGASGWRAFFVGKDERSKWGASGAETVDAEEVDTSAAAMTATHRLAPVVSFGSAWGMAGAFYDAVTSGSDGAKVVLGPAPTWVAAPHISEESTRRKERDPRRWAREYACQFQAGALGCFPAEDIDRAFATREPGTPLGHPICVVDPSSGRKDRFTYAVAQWERPAAPGELSPIHFGTALDVPALRPAKAQKPAPPALRFLLLDAFDAEAARQLGAARLVERIVAAARKRGAEAVHSDQREAFALQSEFRRAGMRFVTHDWTASSKPEGVSLVRRWMREGTLALPEHAALRSELLAFEERLTASGDFTFAARGSGHDDFVSLLVTTALAVLAGAFRPTTPRGTGGRDPSASGCLGLYESPMTF